MVSLFGYMGELYKLKLFKFVYCVGVCCWDRYFFGVKLVDLFVIEMSLNSC